MQRRKKDYAIDWYLIARFNSGCGNCLGWCEGMRTFRNFGLSPRRTRDPLKIFTGLGMNWMDPGLLVEHYSGPGHWTLDGRKEDALATGSKRDEIRERTPESRMICTSTATRPFRPLTPAVARANASGAPSGWPQGRIVRLLTSLGAFYCPRAAEAPLTK
jgi:hypothetical protein